MYARLTVLTLVLCFGCSQAADVPTEELAKCIAVGNDIARLNCFDELGRKHTTDQSVVPATSQGGTGKWVVKIDVNPIDDSQRATMVLKADTGKSSFSELVALVIRCSSHELNVYINWNDYLGDSAEVLTRIGSQKARTQRWPLSTDSQATFYPHNPKSFLLQLSAVNRLVAQVTPYNESPTTAIFDLTGMSNAMGPVREACGWIRHTKDQKAFRGPILGEIMHEELRGAVFVLENDMVSTVRVERGSRAEKSGLLAGDIVSAINNEVIVNLDELNDAISTSNEFQMTIEREGMTKRLKIR